MKQKKICQQCGLITDDRKWSITSFKTGKPINNAFTQLIENSCPRCGGSLQDRKSVRYIIGKLLLIILALVALIIILVSNMLHWYKRSKGRPQRKGEAVVLLLILFILIIGLVIYFRSRNPSQKFNPPCSSCGGRTKDIYLEGVILGKCTQCGLVKPKSGVIYRTDKLMQIASRCRDFKPY